MTTEVQVWRTVVEVQAAVADTSDEFLERAIAELGIWGGMSSTVNRDENLTVTISFDPNTADDGIAGIAAWCDRLGVEYSMTLHRWLDE